MLVLIDDVVAHRKLPHFNLFDTAINLSSLKCILKSFSASLSLFRLIIVQYNTIVHLKKR